MMELAPPPADREGVTETEGQIMGFLCDHRDRELFQRDVEEAFCIRRSTATRFLQNLERDGMLLRQSVPQDARLKRLVLTPKALAAHAQIEASARTLESLITQGLTEEEISRFLTIARKIRDNLT